jgi:hypothetical protein
MCGMIVRLWSVDRWFDPRSDFTKNYIFCICCFSAKHAVLKNKNKDWLVRDPLRIMCPSVRHVYPQTVVSVSYHYKNLTKGVGLLKRGHRNHLIQRNLFSSWYSWEKKCSVGLKQQSLTQIQQNNNKYLRSSFNYENVDIIFVHEESPDKVQVPFLYRTVFKWLDTNDIWRYC